MYESIYKNNELENEVSSDMSYFWYSDDPFETMPLFINRCKNVVKFFHNHQVPKAQLQEHQKTMGAQGLVCPVLTHWGTIQQMYQTLMGSRCHLHTIVNTRNFVKGLSAQKAECRRFKE